MTKRKKAATPEVPPALLQLLNTKPGSVAALAVGAIVAAPWWVPRCTQILWDLWHGIRGEERPPDTVFDLDAAINTWMSLIPGMAPVTATSYCQLPDGSIHHRLNITDEACEALGGTNVYPGGKPPAPPPEGLREPEHWEVVTGGPYRACRRTGKTHEECKHLPGWSGWGR